MFMLLTAACQEPDDDSYTCKANTTSHQFVWEVDTLDIIYSELDDMTAISKTDVWMVGYFNTRQSIDEDSGLINAIHWDGLDYEMLQIPGRMYGDSLHPHQIYSVFALSIDDIWITFSTGAYGHWDGNVWRSELIGEARGGLLDIWGTSNDNLYFSGTNGSLTLFDGQQFSLIETNTDITLTDIYGFDEDHIWMVGFDTRTGSIRNIVLAYQDGNWLEIHNREDFEDNFPPNDLTRPSGEIECLWAHGDTLYLGGISLWKESISTGEGYLVPLEQLDWGLRYGMSHLVGNQSNDIFAFPVLGLRMTHFNGNEWRQEPYFTELDPSRTNFSIRAVSVLDNDIFIAAVDFSTGNHLIFRGQR
ncbi:MAG: hypothetical protein KAU50_01555 [Candidatus Marinimicrobia bacterium]|nr:hypothetical protein [Candidatus Neomarinimicrobiota bacterium]